MHIWQRGEIAICEPY